MTGEGNLQYNYFCVSSNFRRFNFRHAVAVRKLNPFENNRLYGNYPAVCIVIIQMDIKALFMILHTVYLCKTGDTDIDTCSSLT